MKKRKLTLSVRKDIIKKIKDYSKKHNISVSQLVENYLKILIEDNKRNKAEVSQAVKELSGIIKEEPIEDYSEYLEKKYRWKKYF